MVFVRSKEFLNVLAKRGEIAFPIDTLFFIGSNFEQCTERSTNLFVSFVMFLREENFYAMQL